MVFAADDTMFLPSHALNRRASCCSPTLPTACRTRRRSRTGCARCSPRGRFAVVNWRPVPRVETRVRGEPRGPATGMRLSPEHTRAQVAPGVSVWRRWRTFLPTTTERSSSGAARKLALAELRKTPLPRGRVNRMGCRKDQKAPDTVRDGAERAITPKPKVARPGTIASLCRAAVSKSLEVTSESQNRARGALQLPLMPPEDESVSASGLGFRNL